MNSRVRCMFFLIPALLANSCANEVEVLGDYEENAAVFALLDPSQPRQFVKINKVFTNPHARASDVAKIADSLYFDTLAPFLTEVQNGAVLRKIPLYRANVLLKDEGTFATAPNYLYVTNESISSLFEYRLEFMLPATRRLITAKTNIVRMSPGDLFLPVNPASVPREINIPPFIESGIQVKFATGKNGKIYDAFFIFNYLEVNNNDTNIKTVKTIRWKILKGFRTVFDRGNEIVSQRMPGRHFYDMLLQKIAIDSTVTRRFMPCSLEFTGGNAELDNYIQSTLVSIGIVQKQQDYTNIEGGGIGIFAARTTAVIDNVMVGELTRKTLYSYPEYSVLGFK